MDYPLSSLAPTTSGAVRMLLDPVEPSGRFGEIEAMAREVGSGQRPPTVVLWRCARTLSISNAHTRLPGFAEARARLEAEGWPVSERSGEGGAIPLTPGTLQITLISPDDRSGHSLETLCWRLVNLVQVALMTLGVPSEIRKIARAYCPDRFDVAVGDQKIAGLSSTMEPGNGAVVAQGSILIDADPHDAAVAVNLFHALAGSPERCDPAAGLALHALTRADPATIHEAFIAAAELPSR